MSDPAPKRRWFRFSLQTLFVVVTVVGAWLAWQMNFVRERIAMRQWILTEGGYIDDSPDGLTFVTIYKNTTLDYERSIPRWREWLGDRPARLVLLPPDSQRDDAVRALNAFPEMYYLARIRDQNQAKRSKMGP